MAKTGVDQEKWSNLIDNVSFSVESIFAMTPLQFKVTNLAPFTNFNNYISDLNASLGQLRNYTAIDATNMKKAGKNKVLDDAAGAANMGITGGSTK